VSYRDIRLPGGDVRTIEEYVSWADREGLLQGIAGCDADRCPHCFGATFEGAVTCQNCAGYADLDGWTMHHVIDLVVPITYSPDNGLESLLHRYKWSDPGERRDRFGSAIASMLYTFLARHGACLEADGPIDFAVVVPPTKDRGWKPLRYAIERRIRVDWPLPWRFDLVTKIGAERPGRGHMRPDLYGLTDSDEVDGQSILVVDDTWTSGSTMASVAQLLKAAGAARVVGVPIGRQVHGSTFGNSQALYDAAQNTPWSESRCLVCE
jgi:predicted amidophosphoribosyltransferase